MTGLLDMVLIGGTLAVFCIVVATLVLAAICVWAIEAAAVHVRVAKRWLRGQVRCFFADARAGRVVTGSAP
jgi:hypothetical protein